MQSAFEKILVICGTGVGNILLATPLIRSLRRAYLVATIDVLVPEGREGILEGNPDVNDVIRVRRRQGIREDLRFVRRLWRHYDIALSTQADDRSVISACMASELRFSHWYRCGLLSAWQRLVLNDCVGPDCKTHVVVHGLRLLDPLGIAKQYELVPPACSEDATAALDRLLPFSRPRQSYAVLHFFPRNMYKCWTLAGWIVVIQHLASRGMPMVLTGAAGQQEQDYIRAILARCGNPEIVNLSGQISLAQVSNLLKGCSLYVGPDTGITHVAAAQGCPTVALYGPTDHGYWGPWPKGYAKDQSPFDRQGSQRRNNVYVVRRESGCILCSAEGCHSAANRPSRCMEELTPESVIDAIDEMLVEVPRPAFDDHDQMYTVIEQGESSRSLAKWSV